MPRAASIGSVGLAECIRSFFIRPYLDLVTTTGDSDFAGIVIRFATLIVPSSLLLSPGPSCR